MLKPGASAARMIEPNARQLSARRSFLSYWFPFGKQVVKNVHLKYLFFQFYLEKGLLQKLL